MLYLRRTLVLMELSSAFAEAQYAAFYKSALKRKDFFAE